MNLARRKPMTLAEFPEWEERQPLRYEFDGVGPVAMTGGTLAHARIQRNLAFALTGSLRGKPCEFLGSDLKIKTTDDHVRYPDGFVTCTGGENASTVVSDLVVIFEVLTRLSQLGQAGGEFWGWEGAKSESVQRRGFEIRV